MDYTGNTNMVSQNLRNDNIYTLQNSSFCILPHFWLRVTISTRGHMHVALFGLQQQYDDKPWSDPVTVHYCNGKPGRLHMTNLIATHSDHSDCFPELSTYLQKLGMSKGYQSEFVHLGTVGKKADSRFHLYAHFGGCKFPLWIISAV